MDASLPLTRWLWAAALAFAASVAARGQAPDGPRAPDTLPPIKEPTLLPPAGPAATVTPTSYSTPQPVADPLREKQIQIAAYIGTDAVITEDDVWQMVRQRARDYYSLAGRERDAKEKEIYKDELRRLIERELVVIELTGRLKKNKKDDILREMSEMADKSATKRLTDYRKQMKFDAEEEFLKGLKSQGLSYKGLHRQLAREFLMNLFLDQMVKDKVKFITLNDLWDYYQANAKEFATDDRAKWLDLFVPFNLFPTADEARKYADGVWRQATAGADFAGLVKKYGRGDSNLRDGEGVGQKRGEVQPPEMEGVIFGMDAGQLSPLLQTATGYHIVKVTEREKAGVKPFDQKVQIDIREKLGRQVQKQEHEKLMDELWRKYRPKVVE
jgi:peptidyl-prolyl cis-trans isomerase SurA